MQTVPLRERNKRPHVVFIPVPAQSHIKCMLKLARLLHHKGLQITFVNTESNHNLLLKSAGSHDLNRDPSFQFKTVPDGVASTWDGEREPIKALDQVSKYLGTNFLNSFLDLVAGLDTPVTCIICDGFMTFTKTPLAAEKLGVPIILFWTFAACGFMGFYQAKALMEKGLVPLKDESYLTNGYLETLIDVQGMKGIRLKDLPEHVYGLKPMAWALKFMVEAAKMADNVSHVIIHTFDELEDNLIKELKSIFTDIYTVGPLQLLLDQNQETETTNFSSNGYSLWKEEPECVQWLESKEPNSSHGGWGSVIESLSAGVPMICWPFSGDQRTNCRQMCKEWEVGMEIGRNVKRDEVEKLLRELMEGVEGRKMRNKAMGWKKMAEIATGPNGSSSQNIEKLVNKISMFSRNLHIFSKY